MTVSANLLADLPAWLPDNARLYLRHIEEGQPIRAIARSEGCHASTVLRKVRAYENRRDDPLVDEILTHLGQRCTRLIGTAQPIDQTHSSGYHERTSFMTAPIRSPKHQIADQNSIDREARRILRRLCEVGAVLAVAPEMEKAVVLKGTVRTGVVERSVAQAFALMDWIAVQKTGRVTIYGITTAGRAALKRLLAQDEVARRMGLPKLRHHSEISTGFGMSARLWSRGHARHVVCATIWQKAPWRFLPDGKKKMASRSLPLNLLAQANDCGKILSLRSWGRAWRRTGTVF